MYRLRDFSGLPRQEFYRRYFACLEEQGTTIEVDPGIIV
jgi:hypothetical protein